MMGEGGMKGDLGSHGKILDHFLIPYCSKPRVLTPF